MEDKKDSKLEMNNFLKISHAYKYIFSVWKFYVLEYFHLFANISLKSLIHCRWLNTVQILYMMRLYLDDIFL